MHFRQQINVAYLRRKSVSAFCAWSSLFFAFIEIKKIFLLCLYVNVKYMYFSQSQTVLDIILAIKKIHNVDV